MSAPETGRTPAERAAAEAVGALSSPRPDSAYRAQVARAFASGTLTSRVRSRPLLLRTSVWAPVAAAAAALVVVAFAMNRGPDWQVLGVLGDGQAMVNGVAIPLHSPELSRAVRRGAHVVLPPRTAVDLVAPGQLAARLMTGADYGADVVLPAAPNRWWNRATRGRVSLGNTYMKTGPRFHGALLAMDTPEATAHITGTSFAVLRDSLAGTCVCVMEGRVSVSYEQGRETVQVPAGKRCICPPEGEAEIEPILDYSEHALHKLGEKAGALLGR
jgi:hypothetical protein